MDFQPNFEKPPGVTSTERLQIYPGGYNRSANLQILYHLREQPANDFSQAVIFIPKKEEQSKRDAAEKLRNSLFSQDRFGQNTDKKIINSNYLA